MAAISGVTGQVTHTGGYVVLARGWQAEISQQEQDVTPLTPVGGHQQLVVATADNLLKGCVGSYRCRLAVPKTAVITSGSPWAYNEEEWHFFSQCDPRETTPLGAEWRTFVPGLIRSGCGIVCYLDDTQAGPLPGASATILLTAAAGNSYSVPIVVQSVNPAADVEGDERKVAIEMLATSAPTPLVLPVSGIVGNATFLSDTGRYYSGEILTTSVAVRVNRREGVGEIVIGFVFNGIVGST